MRLEVWDPYLAFLSMSLSGVTVFSLLYGWSNCLKVFCFVRLPLPYSFGRRSGLFCLFTLFCFVFVYAHGMSRFLTFFSSKSGIHEAKGKPREFTTILFPGPKLLLLSFLVLCRGTAHHYLKWYLFYLLTC